MTAEMRCDKCREVCDPLHYFLLYNPILGTYHLCDGCSLALENFIIGIDKRIERRGKTMLKDL